MSYFKAIEKARYDDDFSNGTYACVRLNLLSSIRLYKHYQRRIPGLEFWDKYHITTTYTKEPITGLQNKFIPITLSQRHFKYEIFGETKNVLVLRVRNHILNQLWREGRALGATWNFPTYKPHITLSNSFSGNKNNLPPIPSFDLRAEKYVVQPLKDD